MDEYASPAALPLILYTLAAFFALGAGVLWFRFVDARKARAGAGGAQSFRWLTEAATATGITLCLGASGFLVSLFI